MLDYPRRPSALVWASWASSRSERRTSPPRRSGKQGEGPCLLRVSRRSLGWVSIALNHEPASSPAVPATPNRRQQSN